MKNKTFTKLFFLFFLISINSQTMAQNVIWSEDFGGGEIPLSWTNTDASGQITDTIWEYSTDGPYFNNQPTFSSSTASNGFVIFDSDAIGSLPIPHDVRLTTDAIDCSSLTTVIAKFSNQYAYYSINGVSIAELGVSTDGTTFSYYPILLSIAQNELTHSETIQEIDISTDAAGQSTVYLQFRWRGIWEYAWRIDDIKIQDSFTPLLPDDLAIANDFYAIAPSYKMPQNQIDTIRFLADVANIGANNQNNVTLSVEVERDIDNAIVFSKSINLGTMNSLDTIENTLFTDTYLPPNTLGSYTATYSVDNASGIDDNPDNNSVSFSFEIVENEFAKAPAATVGIAPQVNNWTTGTHYYIYNGSQINGIDTVARYANAITFRVANIIANESVVDESVDVILEKGYDINNNGLIESSERTIVAIGDHIFTNADHNEVINVPLINVTGIGSDIYELEDNTHYLVSVKYDAPASSNNMILLMSDELNYNAANYVAGLAGQERYHFISDIGNTGDYDYIFNFTDDPIPLINLETSVLSSVTTAELKLEQDVLTLFPNPANEFVNVTIDLPKKSKEVRLTVFNIQGQVVERLFFNNIKNQQLQIDVNEYSNGTYMMSIDTDFGHTIQRLLINK
ncbi:MAG: T9SS type A sorting domain-containing protein [Saprospiraceae bacterium]